MILVKRKKVLGMENERDQKSGKICLTQKRYLKKVLHRFKINGNTKSVSTPLAPHFKVKVIMSPTIVEECEYMSHVSYTSVVDSLIHTIVCMRSDLSQAVSMVSRYMHDHDSDHWEAIKWIIYIFNLGYWI